MAVFLVLVVLTVFGQTASFQFVNYDDPMYVSENPIVQEGLTWKGVRWAMTYGQIGHWHPLTWLTHMADCQIYGLWAGGHHWTNVALHAITALLLFQVLRTMTGALWRSAFVAAVFAVHPLRAESVAWIAERKDVLSGMLFMLTLLAYVRYARQPSPGRYVVVLLLFALGLLSKNMLVTLPFVLLLLDWWPLRRMSPGGTEAEKLALRNHAAPFWGLVKEKIPMFVLSVGSCTATALVPEHIWTGGHVPALERVGNALVCYVLYLRQLAFPTGLIIPYLFPPNGLAAWKICLALVGLIGVTVVVFVGRHKRPYLLVGWLWFVGMLVPAIGLVQISFYAHADRYTYLPGIGIVLAATWAVSDWAAKWKYSSAPLGGLMTVLVGVFAIWGHLQTSYWRDSKTLWTHVLACAPDNCVAHNCLGIDFFVKGQKEEAIVQYRKALESNPDYAEALINLGTAYFESGEKKEAIAQYLKALQTNPDLEGARASLGVALFAVGDKEEAIGQYRKALEIKPDYAEARSNLGLALFDKGQKEEAIAQYRKALEIDSRYEKAEYNLGNALATEGHMEEAIVHFRKALEIKPDYAYAHYGLGTALSGMVKWDEAIAQYRQALQIKPDFGQACHNLGKALLHKGDFDGASAYFKIGAMLSPDPSTRWLNLGSDLRRDGDLEEAILCDKHATEINPRFSEAHADLGLALFERGEIKEAMASWKRALDINPDQASVQNNLAWLLATTPDASLRDSPKAVALAEQARQLTGDGNPAVLHTLAAAYADMGRFGDATATARRALELALAQNNDDLTAKLPKEIKLYEADKPLRDAPQ